MNCYECDFRVLAPIGFSDGHYGVVDYCIKYKGTCREAIKICEDE